jgi:hypothetical protein
MSFFAAMLVSALPIPSSTTTRLVSGANLESFVLVQGIQRFRIHHERGVAILLRASLKSVGRA